MPTFREQGFNEVWSMSRGIAGPAGLPKDVETALIARWRRPSARRSTRPRPRSWRSTRDVIKGDAYRKFLKDNEQATKKLMNW